MRRLRPLDRVLLPTLLLVWATALILHVNQVRNGVLAWVPVYVLPATDPTHGPTVRALWVGLDDAAHAGDLRAGDELLDAGTESLRGDGRVGFVADVLHAVAADGSVPIRYARDGEVRTTTLHVEPVGSRFWIIVFSTACAATGTLVLLRVPDRPIGRAVFLTGMIFGTHWTLFQGGRPGQTFLWAVVFAVTATLSFPIAIQAYMSFPDLLRPARMPLWPWAFALFGPVAFTWVFGTPLPPAWGQPLAGLINVAVVVAVVLVLRRNFRGADPHEQRQLKWVVYGLYVGLTPVMLANAAVAATGLVWLHDTLALSLVAIPVSVLIAITRDTLFDIDQLISGAAAYTAVLLLFLVGLTLIVLPLAPLLSAATGLGEDVVRTALLVGLFGTLLPLRAWLQPWVDRVFFARRTRFRRGVDELVAALGGATDARALYRTLLEQLDALLEPSMIALALAADGEWLTASRRAAGPSRLVDWSDDAPLARAWRSAGGPIVVGAERMRDAEAAVRELGAVLALPIRRGPMLVGALLLGERASLDAYDADDVGLLEVLMAHVGTDLLRIGLGRYASRELVEMLAADPHALEPCEREVTIFFSDLRGSTAIAEALDAGTLRQLQDDYFETMVAIVQRHGGHLVKTIGDAIMALWNAPRADAAHAEAAVSAALEMQATLADFNERWGLRGAPPIAVRIGIHTGPAMVGAFGTSAKVEFDARGDAVNLASRTEGLGKAYGVGLVVTEATRARLGARFVCRELDRVRVVGRSQPVVVFEVLGAGHDAAARWQGLLASWERARAAYLRRDWAGAEAALAEAAVAHDGDGPVAALGARCRKFREAPPPVDWDGVYDAATK